MKYLTKYKKKIKIFINNSLLKLAIHLYKVLFFTKQSKLWIVSLLIEKSLAKLAKIIYF